MSDATEHAQPDPRLDEDRAVIILLGPDWLTASAPMGMQREVVVRQIAASRLATGPWRIMAHEDNPRPSMVDAGRLHWDLSRGPQA